MSRVAERASRVQTTIAFCRIILSDSARGWVFARLVAVEVLWTVGLQLLLYIVFATVLELAPLTLVWLIAAGVFVATFAIATLYYVAKAGARLFRNPQTLQSLANTGAKEFRRALTDELKLF